MSVHSSMPLRILAIFLLSLQIVADGSDDCLIPQTVSTVMHWSSTEHRDGSITVKVVPLERNLKKLREISGPITLVSLAGPFGQQKSKLLDIIVPKSAHSGAFEWERDLDELAMLAIPPCAAKLSEDQHVVFMDSPGLFQRGVVFDAHIMSLLSLISSLLIYNTPAATYINDEEVVRIKKILAQVRKVGFTNQVADSQTDTSTTSFLWVAPDINPFASHEFSLNTKEDESSPSFQDKDVAYVADLLYSGQGSAESVAGPSPFFFSPFDAIMYNQGKPTMQQDEDLMHKVFTMTKSAAPRQLVSDLVMTGSVLATIIELWSANVNAQAEAITSGASPSSARLPLSEAANQIFARERDAAIARYKDHLVRIAPIPVLASRILTAHAEAIRYAVGAQKDAAEFVQGVSAAAQTFRGEYEKQNMAHVRDSVQNISRWCEEDATKRADALKSRMMVKGQEYFRDIKGDDIRDVVDAAVRAYTERVENRSLLAADADYVAHVQHVLEYSVSVRAGEIAAVVAMHHVTDATRACAESQSVDALVKLKGITRVMASDDARMQDSHVYQSTHSKEVDATCVREGMRLWDALTRELSVGLAEKAADAAIDMRKEDVHDAVVQSVGLVTEMRAGAARALEACKVCAHDIGTPLEEEELTQALESCKAAALRTCRDRRTGARTCTLTEADLSSVLDIEGFKKRNAEAGPPACNRAMSALLQYAQRFARVWWREDALTSSSPSSVWKRGDESWRAAEERFALQCRGDARWKKDVVRDYEEAQRMMMERDDTRRLAVDFALMFIYAVASLGAPTCVLLAAWSSGSGRIVKYTVLALLVCALWLAWRIAVTCPDYTWSFFGGWGVGGGAGRVTLEHALVCWMLASEILGVVGMWLCSMVWVRERMKSS